MLAKTRAEVWVPKGLRWPTWTKGTKEACMYTTEQRRAALEALVRSGYDFEATRREVGYPDVTTLRR